MGNTQIYDNGTQSEHSALSALACEPRRISRLVSHFLAAWNKTGNPSGLAGYQCIGQFYSHRVTKRTARQSWHSFSFFVVSWDSQDWDPSAKFKNATSAWNTYIIMVLHTMFYGCWHKWVKNRTWRLNCAGAICDIRTVWHRRFHLTPPSTPPHCRLTSEWSTISQTAAPLTRRWTTMHADGKSQVLFIHFAAACMVLLMPGFYHKQNILCVHIRCAPLSQWKAAHIHLCLTPACFISINCLREVSTAPIRSWPPSSSWS